LNQILDKIVDYGINTLTEEEKRTLDLKMAELELELKSREFEAEKALYQDRQSARSMYQSDNKAQKALTVLFTIGYFAITSFMLVFLLRLISIELSDFLITFISSIFGAFNAIMVQIVSFYFGSSQSGEDNGRAMAESFRGGATGGS
jgi:hypothetical protein